VNIVLLLGFEPLVFASSFRSAAGVAESSPHPLRYFWLKGEAALEAGTDSGYEFIPDGGLYRLYLLAKACLSPLAASSTTYPGRDIYF
jgi:hypothetical protein